MSFRDQQRFLVPVRAIFGQRRFACVQPGGVRPLRSPVPLPFFVGSSFGEVGGGYGELKGGG